LNDTLAGDTTPSLVTLLASGMVTLAPPAGWLVRWIRKNAVPPFSSVFPEIGVMAKSATSSSLMFIVADPIITV